MRVSVRLGWGRWSVFGLGLLVCPWVWGQTVLDQYIRKPEPVYAWERYARDRNDFAQVHYLRLVSQTWRTAAEVDRPVWEHELKVTVPDFNFCRFINNRRDTALLLISGGDNDGPLSTENESYMEALALSLCLVVAELKQVPNQPLNFADEVNRPRDEDEILAYSMDQYLKTGDQEWPVHLAMAKSAVQAMNALQEFSQQNLDDVNIADFIVLGGSKRGWTTWLAAAADDRVKAIVPVSIDMLNLGQQFRHHWEVYGFYAPAVSEYEEFDLPCRMDNARGRALLDIIDPYSYLDRFQTLPKLVVNSAGDQFFVSDSSRFYYEALPPPKWLRYTVNTDHAQGDTDSIVDLLLGARSWMLDIVKGNAPPRFSWQVESPNSLRVTVQDRPSRVRLWQATNPNARDFRLEVIGEAWTSTLLTDEGGGVYRATVNAPPRGFTAFLIELEYPGDQLVNTSQRFTTEVQVVPNQLPFVNTACQPPTARNNVWWNPVLSGQGIQIIGDTADFAGAFYLYDSLGNPFWVNFFSQQSQAVNLERFRGPPFGQPWDVTQVQSEAVGSGTWRRLSPTLAEFTYTLDGKPNHLHWVPFQRRDVGTLGGLWYDPNQSGQGVQLLQQQQQLSGAWYHYDSRGQATWFTFVGTLENNQLSADLLRFTGPRLGERWRTDALRSDVAGRVTLTVERDRQLRWQHQVGDVRGTLELVPFAP